MPQTTYPARPLRELFWMAHDEYVQSGGIAMAARSLAHYGDYAGALNWLGVARHSDFRTRPFRGL